ncbi:MAG: hypothetical protein K0Q51_904 [Rickettsiaceae bacterium]|jgi:hypothetical protein|nr:hypothetical protein [Rickettsiaceae bacterium]
MPNIVDKIKHKLLACYSTHEDKAVVKAKEIANNSINTTLDGLVKTGAIDQRMADLLKSIMLESANSVIDSVDFKLDTYVAQLVGNLKFTTVTNSVNMESVISELKNNLNSSISDSISISDVSEVDVAGYLNSLNEAS